jgi:hypothetical protein
MRSSSEKERKPSANTRKADEGSSASSESCVEKKAEEDFVISANFSDKKVNDILFKMGNILEVLKSINKVENRVNRFSCWEVENWRASSDL